MARPPGIFKKPSEIPKNPVGKPKKGTRIQRETDYDWNGQRRSARSIKATEFGYTSRGSRKRTANEDNDETGEEDRLASDDQDEDMPPPPPRKKPRRTTVAASRKSAANTSRPAGRSSTGFLDSLHEFMDAVVAGTLSPVLWKRQIASLARMAPIGTSFQLGLRELSVHVNAGMVSENQLKLTLDGIEALARAWLSSPDLMADSRDDVGDSQHENDSTHYENEDAGREVDAVQIEDSRHERDPLGSPHRAQELMPDRPQSARRLTSPPGSTPRDVPIQIDITETRSPTTSGNVGNDRGPSIPDDGNPDHRGESPRRDPMPVSEPTPGHHAQDYPGHTELGDDTETCPNYTSFAGKSTTSGPYVFSRVQLANKFGPWWSESWGNGVERVRSRAYHDKRKS